MEYQNTEKAIKKMFDEHFHHLVLSAIRYINDYGQAEDIVQDVFVKLLQNNNALYKIDDLKGYLFKAVKNSSLNYLRHIKVQQKYLQDSVNSGLNITHSEEELITINEQSNKIHNAVSSLPDNWKEAFILSKYNNLKYSEIAEEMAISQKTVEKYISKAYKFLREELKDILLTVLIIIGQIFNSQ